MTEPGHTPDALAGVPDAGRTRLEQNKEGLFTSDLTVNEFMLITEAGFDPLGLVVGSSIYHIGVQIPNALRNQEMNVLSEAMYNARELAMTRMEEEAADLDADGVVGVRLDVGRYDWGGKMAEFIAIGTAIRHRDGIPHRAPNDKPFTSDLCGQAFWTLLRTGYRPLGMQRMQSEAKELGAKGVVGVELREKSHGWGSHIIEFFAIGTAVTPTSPQQQIERPTPVLDLNDR